MCIYKHNTCQSHSCIQCRWRRPTSSRRRSKRRRCHGTPRYVEAYYIEYTLLTKCADWCRPWRATLVARTSSSVRGTSGDPRRRHWMMSSCIKSYIHDRYIHDIYIYICLRSSFRGRWWDKHPGAEPPSSWLERANVSMDEHQPAAKGRI